MWSIYFLFQNRNLVFGYHDRRGRTITTTTTMTRTTTRTVTLKEYFHNPTPIGMSDKFHHVTLERMDQ